MEQPVHLEADCARARLALTGAGGILAQVAQILAADAFGGPMLFEAVAQQSSTKIFRCISVLPRSLSMLVWNWRWLERMDLRRLSSSLKTCRTEGQHGGMLEAVGDHPGMIHAGFLVEGLAGLCSLTMMARSLAG
jgi:hypothetical protein